MELERFQKKYPEAFNTDSFVLLESSFSLFSSKERKELSTIYFNLAKDIIENDIMLEEKHSQALVYLNTSIKLDAMRNKGVYNMIAKMYARNNNQIGAYANILISVALGEISCKDEFFIQLIQQCKMMPTPTQEIIKKCSLSEQLLLNLFFFKDIVLILEPGTYTTKNMPIMKDRNIVIIGIGDEVIIENSDYSILRGMDSNLVLYNIHVECSKDESLFMSAASQVFVGSCWFTKCSGSMPPVRVSGRKSSLFMDKCIIANSKNSGGILLEYDSNAFIKNCELYNIGRSAIEVRYGSRLYAEKNNLHHNMQGVLAWSDANEVTLINNIIHNNNHEGILVCGNREPALSKRIHDENHKFGFLFAHSRHATRKNTTQPPPKSNYTKPSQTVVVMQNNQILKNGDFGISADNQANVRIEENEIAECGTTGCIIKGGVDATLINNIIHHNGNGIEIGMNYHGKVVLENNKIYFHKINISQLNEMGYKMSAAIFEVDVQQLYVPVRMIDNKIGVNYSNNIVSPALSINNLFDDEHPFLHVISNTYGFNLLKDLDISSATISYETVVEASTISCNIQKANNKQVSVFLGGIGDLRNIVETVHGFMEDHTEDYNINLLFTINDFKSTILARDLVLLEMINRLPDPKPSLKNPKGLYDKWNKDFVAGVIQILSVWGEKIINTKTSHKLSDCIDSLIESLENNVKKNNNAGFSEGFPSWLSFKYPNTISSILRTLRHWKNSTTPIDLVWTASIMENHNIPFSQESKVFENLKKHHHVDEDINIYTRCRLPVSTPAQSCDDEHKFTYSETNRAKFNVTMLTVPTMEDKVHSTSSIFRAFQVDENIPQSGDQPLTLYDRLLLTLLPKFVSLRASLHRISPVQMQVIPILGDVIDTLIYQLPSSAKFNAVDCSNLADNVSILNILLAAAPRLIDNSLLTMQLTKLHDSPNKPMNEFIEEQLGVSLNVIASLTGITFINAYYQDYAVYVTWKFDITCKVEVKDKKPDTLMMDDVISVANACCTNHTDRIKGLSINTLAHLFRIMIIRFPEETMVQLFRLLFASEGFKKHVQNFAIHLVELKTFMTLHLSLSTILKLEEFKDLKVPIARYSTRLTTNKINMAKMFPMWIRLINPTLSSDNTKKKGKDKKGKNKKGKDDNKKTLNDQEPTHYYFDNVFTDAINAFTITISFYLPVPFYDTHKDWILECNRGPDKISAEMLTLSKVTQENLVNSGRYTQVNTLGTDVKYARCNQCGKATSTSCAGCKLVYYCSKDCQKEDRKRHKKECALVHERLRL